jgi:hypothetical protein
VFPTTDGTDSDEEREMGKVAGVSEPASELERLIAELSGLGLASLGGLTTTFTMPVHPDDSGRLVCR